MTKVKKNTTESRNWNEQGMYNREKGKRRSKSKWWSIPGDVYESIFYKVLWCTKIPFNHVKKFHSQFKIK